MVFQGLQTTEDLMEGVLLALTAGLQCKMRVADV